MGGKTSQSTQSVTIPPEVLARYNAANDAAAAAASKPFQQYSTDPSAFVAPLTAAQQAGISATSAAAGTAQPYFRQAQNQLSASQGNAEQMINSAQSGLAGALSAAHPYNTIAGGLIGKGVSAADPLNHAAETGLAGAYAGAQPYNAAATGLAGAAAGAVNPEELNIGKYINPYLGLVLGGTAAQLNQDNQRAMSGQTGSAIAQGAFGGDRAGIAAANLQRQQQLANAQIYSGILGSGFSSALGAAQQQQGVGLEAAQANRAALGSAADRFQGIGQGLYAQGTGTAAQEAALGQQEFGQGLGAAGAVQGLGAQVFGQGQSTAEQEAALANQTYGMGANTASVLAGLGAGAQGAALQGAQAQIAAGQAQQQTEQAGKTALYNQFLQEQSYPFQTAQFLANVAEGTGALSGSTTTTTQPGGFFSDRRLKEDIRKIGKTFDGQTIYSFKYKGDDRTLIGLMAQDVEKEHPDAVGESHGYRTVDYGKATEDAADRGHFAYGGMPTLPGLAPGDMSAILAAQEGMYAPFGQQGGLYGGAPGGMPRGGSSYVPQANLPVAHLAVAGGLAPQRSTLEEMRNIADLSAKAAPYIKKGIDWGKKHTGSANDDESAANDDGEARGGLVPAKRYAAGGMPYSNAVGLDIPDESPTAKLQTAGDLTAPKSGLSNTKDAAETALDVAKIAAMFMRRGGRAGFADGGAPDDSISFEDSLAGKALSALGLYHTPTGDAAMAQKEAAIRNSAQAQQARDQATQQNITAHVVGGKLATPPGVATVPQASMADMQKIATPRPMRTSAGLGAAGARNVPPPAGAGLAPNATVPFTDAPAPTEVAAPPPAAVSGLDTSTPSAPPPPSLLDRASGVLDSLKAGPIGKYGAALKHGDTPTWLSLLSAISAAGTAPTSHLATALEAGLGAGVQSYVGSKKALADIAQEQAHTNVIEAPAPEEGYTWVPGEGPPGVQTVTGKDGRTKWHRVMNVNATDYGGGNSPTTSTPQAAALAKATAPTTTTVSPQTVAELRSKYQFDESQPSVANYQRAVALHPELVALNEPARASVVARIGDQQANDAARRQLLQLSSAINGLSSSLSGQGYGSEYRAKLSNLATTAARMVGLDVPDTVRTDVENHQLIDKIRELAGVQAAKEGNQRSGMVAQAIVGVLPSGNTMPKTANDIIANQLVNLQQTHDLQAYTNDYVGKTHGLYTGVEPAFEKDTGQVYEREQKALADFMMSPGFGRAVEDLHSADPAVRNRAIYTIDHVKGPNFHRYFTGGQ